MKPLSSALARSLCIGALFFSTTALAQSVWTGSVSTDWSTANNWTPSGVPAISTGGSAVIGSGTVVYTPGGDLTLGGGGNLTISGGTFSQAVGGAWMNIGNGTGSAGTLTITGGSFSSGTSGNMRIGFGGGTGLVQVTGGTFNPNNLDINSTGTLQIGGTGTVNYTGTFSPSLGTVAISGGTFNVSGELQPVGASFSVSGGQVNAVLISFNGASTKLDFSGGTINLSSGGFEGIYSTGTGYLNFTSISSGALHLSAISTGSAANLLSGRVRWNDVIDASAFQIISDGGSGSIIQLVAAIPEPSTYAAFAGVAMLGLAFARRRRLA